VDSGVEQTIDRREKSRAGGGGKTISETIEDHMAVVTMECK